MGGEVLVPTRNQAYGFLSGKQNNPLSCGTYQLDSRGDPTLTTYSKQAEMALVYGWGAAIVTSLVLILTLGTNKCAQ